MIMVQFRQMKMVRVLKGHRKLLLVDLVYASSSVRKMTVEVVEASSLSALIQTKEGNKYPRKMLKRVLTQNNTPLRLEKHLSNP